MSVKLITRNDYFLWLESKSFIISLNQIGYKLYKRKYTAVQNFNFIKFLKSSLSYSLDSYPKESN